uniref:Spindle and kinetochore-associated protein 3 n=1 Tax=Nothobranchius furzeri TaxID=105023 RepID=A0A8C6L7S6_NOTFU
MDPTTTFFSKLRKLAKTLETETERLQRVYESRGEESDSGEAGAMRAYYELNSEVKNKQEKEVSDFIHACRVMEQKVTKDIQAVRTHLEIYGYRVNKQQAEAEALIEEGEPSSAAAEGDGQETDEGVHCSSPPKMEPIFTDGMQTPKLSDFGLSKMQLQRALAGADWCSDVPPMPKMSLPCPSLNIPASPPMPLTPKRALRMDDEELQEPQMHDFGISEHNMPLNNDFTMNLLLKTQSRTTISKGGCADSRYQTSCCFQSLPGASLPPQLLFLLVLEQKHKPYSCCSNIRYDLILLALNPSRRRHLKSCLVFFKLYFVKHI